MAQLVQLQKKADEFKKLQTEIVIVYREEKSGVDGLKKIKSASKTTFTLALDLDKQSSGAYSPDKGTFTNYVIDRKGVIRKTFPGTKVRRAAADDLLKTLREIQQAGR